jgi:hypothetical protein
VRPSACRPRRVQPKRAPGSADPILRHPDPRYRVYPRGDHLSAALTKINSLLRVMRKAKLRLEATIEFLERQKILEAESAKRRAEEKAKARAKKMRGRGRTSVPAEEREKLGLRMKAYWEGKRQEENTEVQT